MKRIADISEISQAAYEILSYLAENPSAQDALDGIADWWLPEKKGRNRQIVSDALAALVGEGLVLEYKTQNMPARYGINRAKMSEIKKLLEEESIRPPLTFRIPGLKPK
jgi:hypothetical protein